MKNKKKYNIILNYYKWREKLPHCLSMREMNNCRRDVRYFAYRMSESLRKADSCENAINIANEIASSPVKPVFMLRPRCIRKQRFGVTKMIRCDRVYSWIQLRMHNTEREKSCTIMNMLFLDFSLIHYHICY
jgi:hypothetical protein